MYYTEEDRGGEDLYTIQRRRWEVKTSVLYIAADEETSSKTLQLLQCLEQNSAGSAYTRREGSH